MATKYTEEGAARWLAHWFARKLKGLRAEALRWLATTGPLAALIVLQSCSSLGLPDLPGVPGMDGGDTEAGIDYDRLERIAADLQCTPAAVHARTVAERDTAQQVAIENAIERNAAEAQRDEYRAQLDAVEVALAAETVARARAEALLVAILDAPDISAVLEAITAAQDALK